MVQDIIATNKARCFSIRLSLHQDSKEDSLAQEPILFGTPSTVSGLTQPVIESLEAEKSYSQQENLIFIDVETWVENLFCCLRIRTPFPQRIFVLTFAVKKKCFYLISSIHFAHRWASFPLLTKK
jgi:hypothetical protein